MGPIFAQISIKKLLNPVHSCALLQPGVDRFTFQSWNTKSALVSSAEGSSCTNLSPVPLVPRRIHEEQGIRLVGRPRLLSRSKCSGNAPKRQIERAPFRNFRFARQPISGSSYDRFTRRLDGAIVFVDLELRYQPVPEPASITAHWAHRNRTLTVSY